MATEKILNTRIQLKYDTLQNWNSSTFALKAGELAIVTTGSMKDNSTHTNAQYPVLFKVGDGEHKFSELPYASALAADVYAWAKADDVVLSGKVIQFKSGDSVVKSVTLNYATPAEVESAISAARELISAEIDADVADEAALRVAADNALSGRIAALESGDASVAKQIENAIKALDSSASQTAGADGLALAVEIVDGKLTSISGSIAAGTYDAAGAAATAKSEAITAAASDATTKAATAKSEAIAAAAEDATTKADAAKAGAEKTASDALAAARTEITAEIDADVKALADGAVKDNTDAIAEIKNGESGILATAKKYTDDEIAELADGAVKANTDAIAAINKADTGILAQAKAYTDEVKDNLLGEGIKDTFDTLVEIQNWIEGDGVNATELAEAIAAEAKTRGEEDTKLQNQIDALGITDGKVASAAEADHAAKADSATSADSAKSLADSAKAEVKAVKVDNAAHADSADVATKASGLDDAGIAVVQAIKVNNAAHADVASRLDDSSPVYRDISVLKNWDETLYTATKDIENLTDTNGALIGPNDFKLPAPSAAIYNIKTYVDTQAQNAKTYADGLAGNYATAAQGAKADSAVQSVKVLGETLTDGGELTVDEAKTALGLKSAAYTEASAYATAAQGGKADTAVQTVVGDTGLKATKSGTEVTIGFDPDVVFVFDCGSATELID